MDIITRGKPHPIIDGFIGFTLFEFYLFTYFINWIFKTKFSRAYASSSAVLFTILYLRILHKKNPKIDEVYFVFIENILLSPMCILFFLYSINIVNYEKSLYKVNFWIIAGMVSYFLLTTPYYLFANNISEEYKLVLYFITAIGFTTMATLITIGIYHLPKKQLPS